MLHALLCLLPAVALLVPLLARRYPGAAKLVALCAKARRPRRQRPAALAGSRGRLLVAAIRGGRLIGCSLAVRPPPAPLAAG